MKKRTIAILVPSLALVGLVGTGFGMYVVNQSPEIDDMDVQISMDSIMVNNSITVIPNGTEWNDPTNHNLGLKESTIGYGFIRPFGSGKPDANGAYSEATDRDTHFAFDVDIEVQSFISDLTGGEIEWQKTNDTRADVSYLPAIRNADVASSQSDGKYDHVLVPKALKMDLIFGIQKEYTDCFKFSYTDDKVSTRSKEFDWSDSSNLPSYMTADADHKYQKVAVYMNAGYDNAFTASTGLLDADGIKGDYATMQSEVYTPYNNCKFTNVDTDGSLTEEDGINKFKCFFGGLDCSIKKDTTTGNTDYAALVKSLNTLKQRLKTANKSFDRSLSVTVDSISLEYTTPSTTYMAPSAGGTGKEADTTHTEAYKINEQWSSLANDTSTKVYTMYKKA